MPHSGYTICTSEQRLSSTTVSHGFDIEWYSSPPFGSHGPSKHSEPGSLNFGAGDPCSRLDTLRSHQRGAQRGGAGSHQHRGLSRPSGGRAIERGFRSLVPASACDQSTPHTAPSQLGLVGASCTIWVVLPSPCTSVWLIAPFSLPAP